ncbi:MAG TPA: GNAT family protein [Acidimicrobiales bacterium]|nr:GNAT family protein [Acidimicrobiales bacterium]
MAGHLDDDISAGLDVDTIRQAGDGTATLTVSGADPGRLAGVLTGIRDRGVDLLSIHTLDRQPVAPVLRRTLTTDRLVLRPATPEDVDATWAYRHLTEVNNWLGGAATSAPLYRERYFDPGRMAATVVVELREPAGRLIGDLMLRREDAWSQLEVADRAKGAQVELGWVLDPGYTGAGYATEGVRELLRYCFDELGIHRVVANCFIDNDASWRLMERVGMRREFHAIAESLHRSGRWLDTVMYAILADEWHEVNGPDR